MDKCLRAKPETEYLGLFIGNGVARAYASKFAIVKNWLLPEMQNPVKFFADYSTPLNCLC